MCAAGGVGGGIVSHCYCFNENKIENNTSGEFRNETSLCNGVILFPILELNGWILVSKERKKF